MEIKNAVKSTIIAPLITIENLSEGEQMSCSYKML